MKNTLNHNRYYYISEYQTALIPNTWTIFNWVFLSIYISNSVNFTKTVLFCCIKDRRRLNEKVSADPDRRT